MKNKASIFLKHILSVLSSVAKSKSAAFKSKTSAAKNRLLLFSFMNKKLALGSLSNKIHNLLHHDNSDSDDDEQHTEDQNKAIVLYNKAVAASGSGSTSHVIMNAEDESNNNDDDKYPDLRHSLFDEEEWDIDEDPNGSVIDMVKNSKEGGSEDFILEDEIDQVADLFIKRFHKQIRLQKLESFKRFQAMLERSL